MDGKSYPTLAAAVAALGTSCGTVTLASGVYRLKEQLTIRPCQQIRGVGNYSSYKGAGEGQGSVISYTGSGAAIAIASREDINANTSRTLEDLTISGTSSKGTGVFIGGDPSGSITPATAWAPGVTLDSVNIVGFAHAIQFGNNTWSDSFDHFTASYSSGDEIFWSGTLTNSGEALAFSHFNIFNSAAAAFNHASRGDITEVQLSLGRCDYNALGCGRASQGIAITSSQNHYEGKSVAFWTFTAPVQFSSMSDDYLIGAPVRTDTIVYDAGGNSQISLFSPEIYSTTRIHYFVDLAGPFLSSDTISILFPRWNGNTPYGYTNAPATQPGVTILDPNNKTFQLGATNLSIGGSPGFTGSTKIGGCEVEIKAGIITSLTGC